MRRRRKADNRQLPGRSPASLAELLASRMVIPAPFTHEAYQSVLTTAAGTPIRLISLPSSIPGTASSLTGMTIRLGGTHYVFYRTNTSLVHQLHVIHHELFHVVQRHGGNPVHDPTIKDAFAELLRPELPNLGGALIRHLVERDCAIAHEDNRQERDAERFAVAMAERLGLTGPPSAPGAPDSEVNRLGKLLSDGGQ